MWDGTVWRFLAPRPGWRAWVEDEAIDLVWQNGGWDQVPLPSLDNLDGVGVNTTADAVNRLAVAAPATLLTHDGAGHQIKVNKSTPADTASLLFQTNWSGRAEMGLAGNDDWSIKLSPDGSSWIDALRLDAITGKASGDAIQSDATDTTGGRLLKVGAFGLGTSGGVPTPGNDANQCVTPGFNYRFSTSGSNAPVGNPYGSTLHVFAGTGGQRIQQLFISTNGQDMWLRGTGDTGATWSDWQKVFLQSNILGTVSQSGGTPTGAIIESGSNANGEYTKFADGTMRCTHRITTSAFGTVDWTFPAAFVTAPCVVSMATVTAARIVTSSGTGSGVSRALNGWDNTGARSSFQVDVTANGYWF